LFDHRDSPHNSTDVRGNRQGMACRTTTKIAS
jgi:hypothetical protein